MKIVDNKEVMEVGDKIYWAANDVFEIKKIYMNNDKPFVVTIGELDSAAGFDVYAHNYHWDVNLNGWYKNSDEG